MSKVNLQGEYNVSQFVYFSDFCFCFYCVSAGFVFLDTASANFRNWLLGTAFLEVRYDCWVFKPWPFFLRASANNEYIVLHPLKKAAKSYGVFPTTTAFENSILKEAGFSEYVLRLDHVSAIRNRLGPLKKDEIYTPQPYPFMGGSDQPETYAKGNVWVFMDIVAQMQGLCE